MNISSKLLPSALILAAIPACLSAQVTISGEIRPRTEFRHGFKTLYEKNTDPAFFTEQRTRLIADYKSDKFFAVLSLQDVRIWGAVSQVYKSDPSMTAVNQAFAGYHFTKNLTLEAGRMELDYDNARMFGNLGWAQQSRSHDLFKFTYTDSLWTLHAGIAFNQDAMTPEPAKLNNTFYSGVNNYKTMQYLWFHKSADAFAISLLFMNQGLQVGKSDSSDVEYNQTLGTYVTLGKSKLKGTIEAYYETGMDGKGRDLSAYLLAGSITYPLVSGVPLTLGVDYASGTPAGENKDKSFNPYYGTNHKFFGLMDYFFVGNSNSNSGVTDIHLSMKTGIGKTSALVAALHQFMTAVDIPEVVNPSVNLSKNLGTEIDLVYNINLAKGVAITAGYSEMFATSTMEAIKPGNGTKDRINNWAWLMLTFKPVFYSSK